MSFIPPNVAPTRRAERRRPRDRVAIASTVGSIIEYYDFTLFGLAVALVFGAQFFSADVPGGGVLAAFATFGVGFFARPFGGIFFSHFGDRLGRKPTMVVTLLLMGISTALIGLLPNYAQIGVWAPILLVLLRLLQGFGAGAEYVGAVIMVAETGASRRRGVRASLPGMGVFGGILLATLVFTAASTLTDAATFAAWGWRIPFLLSLAAVALGLYFRVHIDETPVFTEQAAGRTPTRGRNGIPLLEVIKQQPKSLLIAMASNGPFVAMSYLIQVFLLSYVTNTLGVDRSVGLLANVVASALAVIATPLFGALSDRIGRRPVWLAGAGFLALFSFPMLWMVQTEGTVLIVIAVSLGLAVGIASMYAAQASLFSELFETRFRFTGMAFSREVTAALIAGPAPFIAAAMLEAAGGSIVPIGLAMVGLAVVAFVAILFVHETRGIDLSTVREHHKLSNRDER